MKNNKIIHRYLREIRIFFPVYRQPEKRYMHDLQRSIEEYAETSENLSFESLVQEFGEPKDLISNYILEQDASALHKAIKTSRYIKVTALTAIVAFIIIVGTRGYYEQKHFQEAKDAYIHREITVINESTEE